jgi:hypothetical protein
MTHPLDPDRPMDPQGVRRMHDFVRLTGSIQADLTSITLAFGVGRVPSSEELEILRTDGRDLVDHARELKRLVEEVAGLWRQGKHHAGYEDGSR